MVNKVLRTPYFIGTDFFEGQYGAVNTLLNGNGRVKPGFRQNKALSTPYLPLIRQTRANKVLRTP
jgi:hypothetical protein